MQAATQKRALVIGATGFIGHALVGALVGKGVSVVATSRHPQTSTPSAGVEWRVCDLQRPETLPSALAGVQIAYYLAHSMGEGSTHYGEVERRSAQAFAEAAASAGLERIVYLGGPEPSGPPSPHLQSRLIVGETLRAGAVPAVELRASMVIGHGSVSWQIVRDLAVRLPAMVLPKWLRSRTRPVAVDDVVTALIGAAELPLQGSAWFDIPGPEVMSGRQILDRIGALRGKRIVMIEVPLLTPRLSALWLRLVTRANFAVARELVLGLGDDLLPKDDRFWQLIGHTALSSFDDAARRAFADEARSNAGPTDARRRQFAV